MHSLHISATGKEVAVTVVISGLEVAPGTDLSIEPDPGQQVYRALTPDARFRYLTLGERPPTVRTLGPGQATVSSGRYEVIHSRDEAARPFDPDIPGRPVTFINCMLVRPGEEDLAFSVWQEVNAYMVTKPGYRWHRLHRRVDASAPFGQINVARWESAEAWAAAHDEGFRALTGRSELPFRPVAALCELLDDPELAAVSGSDLGTVR
jgi:heme-degrading monooxygenase HmoA